MAYGYLTGQIQLLKTIIKGEAQWQRNFNTTILKGEKEDKRLEELGQLQVLVQEAEKEAKSDERLSEAWKARYTQLHGQLAAILEGSSIKQLNRAPGVVQ